jgi:rhamnulokinase
VICNKIAIDIGASGGKVLLGGIRDNAVRHTREAHRFPNGMIETDGQLCWGLDALFNEVMAGIHKCTAICAEENMPLPNSIGIVTWGVDFVLLDKKRRQLGNAVAYRDARTNGMREKVHSIIPEPELFVRTGIQPMPFNTIYQLMALKETRPELLERAAYFLMIPDYLHYRLCGVMCNEYTNATSTGLVNAHTRRWDEELITRLGFPRRLFGALTAPGTCIGHVADASHMQVIVPATHDTASAAITAQDDAIYISSGTWSVMGIKSAMPDTSETARIAGFSNEGGYGGGIILCTNIMGMWMIQSLRRELNEAGEAYEYHELCEMAEQAEITSTVDCNDERFFAPQHMARELQAACAETNQPIPRTPAQLARVVYQSLAENYAKTASRIETLTNRTFNKIHIIGGGAQAGYLNRLTAALTGKEIIAGPFEAAAMGNLIAQQKRGEL